MNQYTVMFAGDENLEPLYIIADSLASATVLADDMGIAVECIYLS